MGGLLLAVGALVFGLSASASEDSSAPLRTASITRNQTQELQQGGQAAALPPSSLMQYQDPQSQKKRKEGDAKLSYHP